MAPNGKPTIRVQPEADLTVVGSAVPMIIGKGPWPRLTMINDFDRIVYLALRRRPLYVRYSEGPERDREGPSRDYESGLILPGLCVTPLNPPAWWTRPPELWVARRMCKYANLVQAPRHPRPWLLDGREVGVGPDHEPLIAEATPVAWVGRDALAQAARIYQEFFAVGQDSSCLPARLADDA
jgi:hypothetical protein